MFPGSASGWLVPSQGGYAAGALRVLLSLAVRQSAVSSQRQSRAEAAQTEQTLEDFAVVMLLRNVNL